MDLKRSIPRMMSSLPGNGTFKVVLPATVAGVVSAAVAWGVMTTRVDGLESDVLELKTDTKVHRETARSNVMQMQHEITRMEGLLEADKRETTQYRQDVRRRLESIEQDLKILVRRRR